MQMVGNETRDIDELVQTIGENVSSSQFNCTLIVTFIVDFFKTLIKDFNGVRGFIPWRPD